MTLREYIDGLNQFVVDNPETLDMTVIYGTDAEGNGFEEVYYGPTKGVYDDDEFSSHPDEIDKEDINAVCIN